MASGSRTGLLLASPAVAVASLTLPDGTAVIAAAGDDGSLRWWDAPACRPLDGAAAVGAAPVLSLASVLMPAPVLTSASAPGGLAGRLAGLRDGRTVLAAGDADGVVRLWDPVTRVPVTTLFQRPGRRVVAMTAVNLANHPPWRGTDLVAVYNDLLVDVWHSGSVNGTLSAMAPGAGKLAAVGHQRIIGAGVSPRRLGYRQPVLLADRNGTVSMWETFGTRLSDPLPPDPAHREITGTAILPGAGDGITVVTASRADRNLRIWEPQRGSAALLPLSIRPRCLLTAGDALSSATTTGSWPSPSPPVSPKAIGTTCKGHAQIHPSGMKPMLTGMACDVPNGGSGVRHAVMACSGRGDVRCRDWPGAGSAPAR